MANWIDKLTTSRTTHAVSLAAQFAEHRQRVFAENIANVDTPDYHTKHLDREAFQDSLREALQHSKNTGRPQLELRGNAQFSTGNSGRLDVRPVEEPAENVLFHDGTNARLEGLIAGANANALDYELAMNALRGRYEGLLRAIRGRLT